MSEDLRIGVDIGGTFTDLVMVRDGSPVMMKTPSVPDSPEQGVLTGLEELIAETGVAASDVGFLGHGTTVGTNTVLEQSWGDTALVTTAGFRDVLEIGRQNRPELYDFQAVKPEPIVERDKRFEVPERLNERGEVIESLDESVLRSIRDELRDSSVESVAVSLLFSFENPQHEERVRAVLAEDLDVSFSLSSQVAPEIQEYERTLTTTVNAALKPMMESYLGELEIGVGRLGFPGDVKIMQSNGGVITTSVARERPVNTVLSGPAAGVKGAAFVATRSGLEDVITMDMGGTSCDVSLVEGTDPVVSTDVSVGEYPITVPMIDVHTIGAGGGSIAWIDTGNALRVGPRSAGADPGPVCYGQGGTEPTVTDAQFVLGRVDPERFETVASVDEGAVSEVLVDRVGDQLGMDASATAQGIIDVANANMERALRVVSVERGYDPREFGLVAFGGAGPLHAAKLAEELDIPRVLVPQAAGVLSALGLLVSDIVIDYSTSRVRSWEEVTVERLQAEFCGLEAAGSDRLGAEGVGEDAREFERIVEVRYAGQSFELPAPVPSGEISPGDLDRVADGFHRAHRERYGYATPGEPLELVTIRLQVIGQVDPPRLVRDDPGVDEVSEARTGYRDVVFNGTHVDTPVYEWRRLPTACDMVGPAIIEGAESTIVVYRDQTAIVDSAGNVVISV